VAGRAGCPNTTRAGPIDAFNLVTEGAGSLQVPGGLMIGRAALIRSRYPGNRMSRILVVASRSVAPFGEAAYNHIKLWVTTGPAA
jgi:hypothetical protein